MFKILLVFFIIIPIIEIALLIQVSEIIGGWSTIALVVITALIGAKLVKQQGTDALRNVQLQMAQGQMPAQELFSGLCVIIAGVLLVTPGIMTDIFGFLLLTPAIRQRMAKGLLNQASVRATSGAQGFQFSAASFQTGAHAKGNTYENQASSSEPKVLEGEFIKKD